MDITYIPMARGFVYLAAVVDWFSRRVLAWRLSITLEAEFCLEAVEEALARHGKPEIFNTDQGSQFTSAAFTGLLLDNADRDQHGWQRRLARQRLRRAAVAVGQIRGGLSAGLRQRRAMPALRSAGIWTFYNGTRPHSSLGCPDAGSGLLSTICRSAQLRKFAASIEKVIERAT